MSNPKDDVIPTRMHTYTSSSSDFDGRRLSNLLSSWKKSSWNERRDKDDIKLRKSRHRQNVPWFRSNAGRKECRDVVSDQPNCQRRDLKPFNSIEKHSSSSSTIASDQPIDYLLHYSQYLLMRHADDSKSLSTPTCCGKTTHMKHVFYSAHQEHISMSLDYYVSKWEEHQEREFEDTNYQVPKSQLCGNSKIQCNAKEYKTKIFITSLVISIILFIICDVHHYLINNDFWMMSQMLRQAEGTNGTAVKVMENILTSQVSIISLKMDNLESTSEISPLFKPVDRKNEKQGLKLLQNFTLEVPEYSLTVAEIVTIPELTVRNNPRQKLLLLNVTSPRSLVVSNDMAIFAETVAIPESIDRRKDRQNKPLNFSNLITVDVPNYFSAATIRNKIENNRFYSLPSKFLEFHRKRQELLDSNTCNYGEIFTTGSTKLDGVRLSSTSRNGCGETNFIPQSSFSDVRTLPSHLQSMFVYSELRATAYDSITSFCDSETTKLPMLVYPSVAVGLDEVDDDQGFLETPLTDIFEILFKQLSSKVQSHTRRGSIGLWGLRSDPKKGCSFGLLKPC